PGQFRPLILDSRSRLYLYRYWDYQNRLSELIRSRVNQGIGPADMMTLKERLNRLFPDDGKEEIDWQRVAALIAFKKSFCIISGGPGTGKTTTVAKILVLLLEQASPERLRIALTAPTGKAAARLKEALKRAKTEVNCQEELKEAIPEETSTIHRLLGSIPGSPRFQYNAQNRLPIDVVVVDEASMVDLALMSKLIQAIPDKAKLILLGDKDQLASVEAGSVLGDICDRNNNHGFSRVFWQGIKDVTEWDIPKGAILRDREGIHDCIVQLQKNYRFGKKSGIYTVSRAVNSGDSDQAFSFLQDEQYRDIHWNGIPSPRALEKALRDVILKEYGDQMGGSFERFRVLCALREGPYGVIALNRMIEKILKDKGVIKPETGWYAGRPIMITKNDYNLQLFNGDLGMTLPDPMEKDNLRVFFQSFNKTPRTFHPLRLPDHETVYAMTVHKSQGSEFDRVMLFLSDRDSPVLTRELVYTGITRARKQVHVWGSQKVFRLALSRRIQRASGLRDALWETQ
ncbi:MAG: exodeoxyribonuclease V subunit alpha, partial [Pseudomonadota bacterium]